MAELPTPHRCVQMRHLCLSCQAEYPDRPQYCGACLSPHHLAPLPDKLAGRDVAIGTRRRAGVATADTLRPVARPAPWGEPWASTWLIGEGAAVLLVGP